ncbi:hypothetical protein EV363DRAFT_1164769 [Boletus edulis]|nr:hypothetical protein EV363DRAFT_1164769 [Boletus edulis]
MVSRCVLTFCGCVLAFLIGGRLDRLTWHGLHLSRSRIARLGFPLPYASTGGVYHVVWVVYDHKILEVHCITSHSHWAPHCKIHCT